MWALFRKTKAVPASVDPDPMREPQTITLAAEDAPMIRARHVFQMMGLGIRSDEIGEFMQRRTAEILASYRDLDRKAAIVSAEDLTKAA